jgi:hypothetical protein
MPRNLRFIVELGRHVAQETPPGFWNFQLAEYRLREIVITDACRVIYAVYYGAIRATCSVPRETNCEIAPSMSRSSYPLTFGSLDHPTLPLQTGPKSSKEEGERKALVRISWYILSAARIVTTVDVVIAGHYSPTVNALGFPKRFRDVLEWREILINEAIAGFLCGALVALFFMRKPFHGKTCSWAQAIFHLLSILYRTRRINRSRKLALF